MSPKYINFFAYSWFCSTLICLAMEGTYFGSVQGNIVNQLSVIQTIQAGNFFSVGGGIIDFFQGLVRIFLFDYSFYTGGYEILRWFWVATLGVGVVWGLITGLATVVAAFMPRIGG